MDDNVEEEDVTALVAADFAMICSSTVFIMHNLLVSLDTVY